MLPFVTLPFINIKNREDVNKSVIGRLGMEWIYMPITLLPIADHSSWKVAPNGDLQVNVTVEKK